VIVSTEIGAQETENSNNGNAGSDDEWIDWFVFRTESISREYFQPACEYHNLAPTRRSLSEQEWDTLLAQEFSIQCDVD
jgi:hypothetical protein